MASTTESIIIEPVTDKLPVKDPKITEIKAESPRSVSVSITKDHQLDALEIEKGAIAVLNKAALTAYKAKEISLIATEKKILPSYNKDMHGIVISESALKLDSGLWRLITILCELTNTNIFAYPSVEGDMAYYNPNNSLREEFIIGLLIGVAEPLRARLTPKTTDISLGKTCAFAMKLKSWFEVTHLIPLLVKNHSYLGNDERSGVERKERFLPKQYLVGAFDDKDMGRAYWALVTTLFRFLNLSQFDDSDFNSIVNSHIVSFDNYCKAFLRPIYSKKKGKTDEITGYQRPKLPTSSPLLLSCEIKLIKDFVSPIWSELDIYKKSWLNILQREGYQKTVDNVSAIYKSRWEIVRNISQMTTKRLQDLRKILKDEKLIKVKVTSDNLLQLLKSRANPGKSFLDELFVIGGKEFNGILVSSFQNRYQSKEIEKVVSSFIIDGYITEKVIVTEREERQPLPSTVFNTKYQSGRKSIIEICSRLRHLRNLYVRFEDSPILHVRVSIAREGLNVAQNVSEDNRNKLSQIEGEIIELILRDLSIPECKDFKQSLHLVEKVYSVIKEKGLDKLKKKLNLSATEQTDFISTFTMIKGI